MHSLNGLPCAWTLFFSSPILILNYYLIDFYRTTNKQLFFVFHFLYGFHWSNSLSGEGELACETCWTNKVHATYWREQEKGTCSFPGNLVIFPYWPLVMREGVIFMLTIKRSGNHYIIQGPRITEDPKRHFIGRGFSTMHLQDGCSKVPEPATNNGASVPCKSQGQGRSAVCTAPAPSKPAGHLVAALGTLFYCDQKIIPVHGLWSHIGGSCLG